MNRAIQRLGNHNAQTIATRFRRSSLVPTIILFLFSVVCAVPLCAAQHTRASRAPLPIDTKTFQQIEDRWSVAVGKRDQYTLELVLSPELIDVSATGDMTTRNQQIAMLFEKGAVPPSLDRSVLNARIFGDLAIVIGTYDEQLRVNGKPVRRQGMFTHIYQNVRGNWLCIHAHRTETAEPTQKETRGAKKQVDAAHVLVNTTLSTQ